MGTGKKGISSEEKADLRRLARFCEDHAPTDDLERMGRNIYRQMDTLSLTVKQAGEIKTLLREALAAMDTGQTNPAA